MNLSDILSGKAGEASLEPLIVNLPADLETPVSAFLKLRPVGAKFLLESADGVELTGRYTFIGIRPRFKVDIFQQKSVIISPEGSIDFPHSAIRDPFTALRHITKSVRLESNPSNLTLLGGLVGHINYEMVGSFEPCLGLLGERDGAHLASFYFVDTLLVFDHFTRRMQVIALVSKESDLAKKKGKLLIDEIISALRSDIKIPQTQALESRKGFKSNFTQGRFEEVVEDARKNILKGNIFQGVLSQALQAEIDIDSFQIYRALRMLNPSPYMYYLEMDDLALIGSSPETMVKLSGETATLRPIAGTRPRGRDESEDKKMENELLSDDKEKAEHIMLVDLGRNDLGRACEFGSVVVDRLMEVERFSHVMHMTSTITGRLKKGNDQFDLFKAAFPAGTVTGAPKIRAMELIHQLEGQPRGPYAGCIGYFSLSGDMDMCITIRTIIKEGNKITLQAGAGIVADSKPQNEYQETLNKLEALEAAVANAEGGLI
ncbi:MAG: anthranilate synthase component I family protein [candidate division Zixibacteria bacterium]